MKKYRVDSCGDSYEVLSYKAKPSTKYPNYSPNVLKWVGKTGEVRLKDHGDGVVLIDTRSGSKVHLDYFQLGCIFEAYFIWKHEGRTIHTFSIHEKALVADERGKK